MKKHRKYYSIRSFLSYIQRFKFQFGVVLLCFILANAFLAIIPVFIGKLVGSLAANPINEHQAFIYVGALIVCSSGHDLIWRLSEILFMKLLNPLAYSYDSLVFKEVIQRPYPYFVDKLSGKIAANIGTLGQEFRDFLVNTCYNYSGNFVGLVAITIILTTVNWQTGLIFIISVLCMVLTGRYTVRNSLKYEQRFTDVQSTKTGKIVDAIANFVNVKSFQKEAAEIASIQHQQARTIEAARLSYFWSLVFWGSMSFFVRHLIWPLTILLNVYLFLNHQISLAQLTTFLSTVLLFSNFIWEIVWNLSQFNLKLARTEEAHNYLFGSQNIIKDHYRDLERSTDNKWEFDHELAIKDLFFSYPDMKEKMVLSDVNISIKKGEKVGIVGRSGSGKTTLTKLLLGYYTLDTDVLLIDGKKIDSRDLAQLIAYVPQDTTLFHRSIAENISYATNNEVTRAEVIRAAKLAHADEFITQINGGYDAMVGERGVKLSAGQRQRVAIARAFLDNKPILVLDEATSALDSESEALIQDALESLWDNKTVIAIAHRLSTLRNMDRIIVIDNGKVAEQGTHAELLKKGGAYASLWNHQHDGFIDE